MRMTWNVDIILLLALLSTQVLPNKAEDLYCLEAIQHWAQQQIFFSL